MDSGLLGSIVIVSSGVPAISETGIGAISSCTFDAWTFGTGLGISSTLALGFGAAVMEDFLWGLDKLALASFLEAIGFVEAMDVGLGKLSTSIAESGVIYPKSSATLASTGESSSIGSST